MKNNVWFFSEKSILNNQQEDFYKFFFPTILISLLLAVYPFNKNDIFLFLIFYLIDSGHIFSTFLETLVDKEQRKNKKIIYAAIMALGLNLLASYLFVGSFFVYIFYFTIFHNLKQGLGILQLHFKEEAVSRNKLSLFYYFGTFTPVILFHFKAIYMGTDLTYSIRPIDFHQYFNDESLSLFFYWGKNIYLIFYFLILAFLVNNKLKGFFTFLFFTGIYSAVFLLINNPIIGMIILVASHGIPYFFIFEKRIKLTHSNILIRKHSFLFVVLFFVIGAILESTQEDISYLFPKHIRNIVFAITFFPMVAHYIYDMILWKSENNNFQIFKQNMQ